MSRRIGPILSVTWFVLLSFCAVAWISADEYAASTFTEHTAYQSRFQLPEPDGDGGFWHLSYVDAGPTDGEPILLVHGVPTSSWSYRHLIALLSKRGFRVIAPDNLGFGNSSKPDSRDVYRLDRQAARLLALMEHLGVPTWTQVLHDVGGPITWEMMIAEPGRIERLVLLNTFAYETGWHPPKSMDNPIVQFSVGLIGFRNRAIIRATICDMLVLREQVDNDLALAGYYEPLEGGADVAYLSFMTGLAWVRGRFPAWRTALRAANLPALILWGAHDRFLVGAEAIPLFQSDLDIPPERIFLRGDAKHLIMEELPEFLAKEIAEFVG